LAHAVFYVENEASKPGWANDGWQPPSLRGGWPVPYFIAEAGVNHNGQIELALQLVRAAKQAGADCVKFQAYTAAGLATRRADKAKYQESSGADGESQYEMLRRYELSEEEFSRIKDYCDEQNVDFLITPFSRRWVRFFETLNVSAYKIGSGNLRHLDLLQAIGETNKPVIVSTGMANLEEVDETLARLRQAGCGGIALLHCVSLYPTPIEKANLKAIRTLSEHTGLATGFSDHTEYIETGFLAIQQGASILEKHLTLNKTMEGPDHHMSLEPAQMQLYIASARQAATMTQKEQRTHIEQNPELSKLYQTALGDGIKEPAAEELTVKRAAGMSVVSTQYIFKGGVITPVMVTAKRPGTGIPADRIDQIVGATANYDIAPDQVIHYKDITLAPVERIL
jgi:N,N'-diacetyllegionaminate synthase